MAGLYVHIPFCKQACHYCNFYFSTSSHQKADLLQALHREMALQRDYLEGARLASIYLGGGTPSLLETDELTALFDRIYSLFDVTSDAEITIEANPDDLTATRLRQWRRQTPVNRLSIGIQSFFDEDLQWMNRAHNARQALRCIPEAQDIGFENLTIDLIYGLPEGPEERWIENVRLALSFDVPHLSCYCLTVEEGTALAHFVRRGRTSPVDEEKAARQLEYLMDETARYGYVHYEISNFARPGHYAVHNSNYWLGVPYLGIGPSAHSYNGTSRQWNIANNALYIKAISEGRVPFEREELTAAQRYNEYVMTRLRTYWGCHQRDIAAFGAPYADHFQKEIAPLLEKGWVEIQEDRYCLTRSGKLLADHIAAGLFWVS